MAAEAEALVEDPDPIAARIREGNHREAIAMCADVWGAALGRFCMALLGNQAEAEEAAQEALIAAHDAMGSYRGDGSVRAWLFGIARRLCARRIETRVRRERRLRLVPDKASEGSPHEAVERARRAEEVRAALDRLKPSERDAVVLRYEAGLSYREIGVAIGIDEAAARKRTSRALARLRTALQDTLAKDEE